MKAAIKMLPPRPIAIPAASAAVAAIRICRQCGSTSEPTREPERERAQDAGGHACDEAVADLLEHEVHRSMSRRSPLVPFGEGKRDEEKRDADSVVQTALDVQPLPDPRRDPVVGDDRLAERRVGAGKHDREHECLDQGDAGQHADPDEGAERDRQRQADPEQPGRDRELAYAGQEARSGRRRRTGQASASPPPVA